MQRFCDWCGQVYTARRPDTSRFCSVTCRKRNFRSPRPPDISKATNGKPAPAPKEVDGSLAETIRAELKYLGLDATTPGVLVLDLAQRIEAPNTSDSSRAPMARELMRLRQQLLHSAVDDELDPLHILQQRRQTKMREEA